MKLVNSKRSGVGPRAVWAILVVLVVAGFITKLVVLPMLLARSADHELAKIPAGRLIARWEPAAYARMKATMVESLRHHESTAQAQGRVRALVSEIAKPYMKTASDEALIEYFRVTIDEMRQMTAKDPSVAFDVLGGRTDIDVGQYIDEQTQNRDAAALAGIISTGVAKEAGYQDAPRATELTRKVVASMRADFGADAELPSQIVRRTPEQWREFAAAGRPEDPYEAALISHGLVTRPDKRRVCEMTLELYNRILALRADQAAQVLRLMLASE